MDVYVVGSANLDLVARTPRLPGPGETVLGHDFFEAPGGKGLNQAVAAARSGARVGFFGMVGTDNAGDVLRAVLEAEEIDTAALGSSSRPTGRALIGVSDDGENSIIVVPGANAQVLPPAVTLHGTRLATASVVLAQMEIPVQTVIAAFDVARHVGATTILNPAPAAPLPAELLAVVDICVPNEHEEQGIGGADALLSAGVTTVITTLGSRGARVTDATGSRHVPAFAVEPVDTTGAGDSFAGALAARLALGDDLDTALAWASAAGALATTKAGAVPSIPRAEEIGALIAGR